MFGDVTTGASDDLARPWTCHRYGEALRYGSRSGPRTYGKNAELVFLGANCMRNAITGGDGGKDRRVRRIVS